MNVQDQKLEGTIANLQQQLEAANQRIEKLELMIGRFQSNKPELGDLSFREQIRSQLIEQGLKDSEAKEAAERKLATAQDALRLYANENLWVSIPWLDESDKAGSRREFTAKPEFHDGWYWAQQALIHESTNDLGAYLARQQQWSSHTFGNGRRTGGIVEHIRKELTEIQDKPDDLSEWIDVVILALDGYWRHGGNPTDVMAALEAKQAKNFARTWPSPISEDIAVEHDRSKDDKALAQIEQPHQQLQKPEVIDTPADHALAELYKDPQFLKEYREGLTEERARLGIEQPQRSPIPPVHPMAGIAALDRKAQHEEEAAERIQQQLPGEDPPFEWCQCSACVALRARAEVERTP